MKVDIYKGIQGTVNAEEIAIVFYYGSHTVLYSNELDPSYKEVIDIIKNGLDNLSLLSNDKDKFKERWEYGHSLEMTIE